MADTIALTVRDAAELQKAVRAALTPLADPVRASGARAYVRGQFEFLGIGAIAFRAAVHPVLRAFEPASSAELVGAAHNLWEMPEREYQYAGIELLVVHRAALRAKDLRELLRLVQMKSWWDTVDALAKVIGWVVKRERKTGQAVMDRALRSKNMWVRRVAMLHQLGWRKETDTARLFLYAETLAPESEFFIRKAVGWALRDYSWHDPEAVARFLREKGDCLSGLSFREAGKRLSDKDKTLRRV